MRGASSREVERSRSTASEIRIVASSASATSVADVGQSNATVSAMGDRLLLFLANREGQPIAGALNFIGPEALSGRYWGTVDEVPFLHFELCYYRAIEWAIDHGLKCVQAGAQGEHKVARGYEPVITKSAHFIPNASFREAVSNFLDTERAAIASEAEWLRRDLPYRSSSSE